MVEVAKIFCYRQNQNQLDPFRWLEMSPTRHLHPSPGAQIFLTKNQNYHQGPNRGEIQPVHSIQQYLVIDETHQEHAPKSTQHPISLLDVRARELGVDGRALNLHDAQPADEQHEDQQHPVKIAE